MSNLNFLPLSIILNYLDYIFSACLSYAHAEMLIVATHGKNFVVKQVCGQIVCSLLYSTYMWYSWKSAKWVSMCWVFPKTLMWFSLAGELLSVRKFTLVDLSTSNCLVCSDIIYKCWENRAWKNDIFVQGTLKHTVPWRNGEVEIKINFFDQILVRESKKKRKTPIKKEWKG